MQTKAEPRRHVLPSRWYTSEQTLRHRCADCGFATVNQAVIIAHATDAGCRERQQKTR